MGQIKDIRDDIEELNNSLDEIFCMIAEQGDMMHVLHRRAKKEDTLNPILQKHVIQLAKHIERLIREKEILLKHIGMNSVFIPIRSSDD